jgi:hypothetical protein
MALWRGQNLDQMFALIKAEDNNALEIQVRGWTALGELYQEQRNHLIALKGRLVPPVWGGSGRDEYLTYVDTVAQQLLDAAANATRNARALHEIGSWIGATQTVMESLVKEFDRLYAGKVTDANTATHGGLEGISDAFQYGIGGQPDRAELLETLGFNDRGGAVMESAMNGIATAASRIESAAPYQGPRNANAPALPGAPAAPRVPGAPAAPGTPGTGPAPAAPAAPAAPSPPAPPAAPPPVVPPPVAPPPPVTPTRPVVPGGVRPPAPPASRVAPSMPDRGVARPGAGRPAVPFASAAEPAASSPAPSALAPGKPAPGQLAPPPFAGRPPGKTRPATPSGPASDEPAATAPGKPGRGRIAPPPSDSRRSTDDSVAFGKRGAPTGGEQFPPTPHLGNTYAQKPQPPGARSPATTHPGRVTRPGGTPAVLGNRPGRRTMPPSPKELGVRPALAPRTRVGKQVTDDRGVIQPAAPRQDPTPAAPARDQRHPDNPTTTEYEQQLFQVAGVGKPVIDAPPAPRRATPGPVIGF